MQTIIVEINVPAVSVNFDFKFPSTGNVGDITDEVIRILEATQRNLLFDRSQPMLCDVERGIVLDRRDTVADTGLQDGAKLILL